MKIVIVKVPCKTKQIITVNYHRKRCGLITIRQKKTEIVTVTFPHKIYITISRHKRKKINDQNLVKNKKKK